MPVVLRPLVGLAVTLLDRLWEFRISKITGVILPDWGDPQLADPFQDTSETEAELRGRLAEISATMRHIGTAQVVRELFHLGVSEDRLAALLALPGSAPWQSLGPATAFRQGTDGTQYRLDCAPGPGAPHAEHAAAQLEQRLTVGPDGRQLAVVSAGGFCLSLACALRDTALQLLAAGEAALADQVAAVGRLDASLNPVRLADPIAA